MTADRALTRDCPTCGAVPGGPCVDLERGEAWPIGAYHVSRWDDPRDAHIAALERELERHRHGVTIEGDFVCPDSLRMSELEREVADLRARPVPMATPEFIEQWADVLAFDYANMTTQDGAAFLVRQMLTDLAAQPVTPSEAEQIAAWLEDVMSRLSSGVYMPAIARRELADAIRSGAWRKEAAADIAAWAEPLARDFPAGG